MTHTQVMATIADTRATVPFIKALHSAGMMGIRINSAHVEPESIRSIISLVREVSQDIKILMDTKGPEMRTTALGNGVESVSLSEGHTVLLTGGSAETTEHEIFVNVRRIGEFFKPGNRLFLDDGEISLIIKEIVGGDSVMCEVVKGGSLGSRKSLSASEDTVLPPLPAVSEKDKVNIAAALETGIDMIAHSFVRSAEDISELRDILAGTDTRLYAKIECREALENMKEIAEAADGLLVARGDLGAQIAIERVPAVQMRVMSMCKKLGKPVIVATQILHSMMTSPQPTRAEVSDIAFGTSLGAEWLLLTGETAKGDFPEECVRVMADTICETEKYLDSCREK
ncbi:MAG: pyruvate kinase [Paramuribaculum sp.]|nr:pyruvate kinase [Paramuribaculum sp.]